MTLLFIYLALALLLSFLCSIMESVLLATPLSFISMKESQGVKRASYFRKHKENIERPLSAILSLNTIANTMGAAGVGAQATLIFGEALFGLISATLTLLILLFSEILPKTVGAYYWKSLAVWVGVAVEGVIYLTYPLVVMSDALTKSIAKKGEREESLSREEFSAIVEIGSREGVIELAESKMIHNIIRLRTIKVEDIMTPRVMVESAAEEMTIAQFHKVEGYRHYSRIPLYSKENKENIVGFVQRQDVTENMANDNFDIKLSQIKREIVVVPNIQPVTLLWERLIEKRAHIALVVDEYGGFEGVVTQEDVIETIFGLEIMDERDIAADLQQLARDRWSLHNSTRDSTS